MTFPPGEWLPLAADASARHYYRGSFEGKGALLADFGADGDGLERFVQIHGLFRAHGLQVPDIYAVEASGPWLVQEFVAGRPLSRLRWTEELKRMVAALAGRIAAIESWPDGPEVLQLDEARLRFELAFFRVHFLEGFLNRQAPEGLSEGLDALAAEVASYPARLAHRDFHSENLLNREGGGIVVLDFQDALQAPRAYDAASLAVDPYRRQDPSLGQGFKDIWLAASGAQAEEFDRTALQRALKALGTFGYQVTRCKKARYMRFIGPQARRAMDLLPSAPVSLECLWPSLEALSAS